MIGSVTSAFALILSRRRLFYSTIVGEIRRRFAGSLLGASWLLLGPLILVVLYAVVYGVVFRLRPPELSPNEYTVYILAGLIPFLAFSDSLTSGSTSLAVQRDVLLNTVFPAEFVPFRAVVVAFVAPCIGILLILLADSAIGRISPWSLQISDSRLGLTRGLCDITGESCESAVHQPKAGKAVDCCFHGRFDYRRAIRQSASSLG